MYTVRKIENKKQQQIQNLIKKYSCCFSYISIRYEDAKYTTIHGKSLDKDIVSSDEEGYTVTYKRKGEEFLHYFCVNSLTEITLFLNDFANEVQSQHDEQEPTLVTLSNSILFQRYRNLTRNERFSLLSEIEKSSKEIGIHISNSRYYDCSKKIIFIDSLGKSIEQHQCNSSYYADVFLDKEEIPYSLPISIASYDNFIEIQRIIDTLKELRNTLQQLSCEAVTPPNGIYNVVLCPQLAGTVFHETIGHLSEADTFHDHILKLGTKVTNERITISDVPLESPGFDFDEEGQIAIPVKIISNGVFQHLLHSSATTDKRRTGNSRAVNYRFPPICRMRQTKVESGDLSLLELFETLDNGLYLVGYKEGGTFEDYFKIECTYGYYIEDGKISSIFPGVIISGSIRETLAQVKEVGCETSLTRDAGGCNKNGQNGLPNEMKSPPILVEKMCIGENVIYG